MIRVRAIFAIVGWGLIAAGAISSSPEALLLGTMLWAVGAQIASLDTEASDGPE